MACHISATTLGTIPRYLSSCPQHVVGKFIGLDFYSCYCNIQAYVIKAKYNPHRLTHLTGLLRSGMGHVLKVTIFNTHWCIYPDLWP